MISPNEADGAGMVRLLPNASCTMENAFIPNRLERREELLLLKTLREYQRAQSSLSRRNSPGIDRIREQLSEAVSAIEKELQRRGCLGAFDC